MTNKKIALIIIGGTIGNVAEWYNFLLYSYLATTMAQLFFPTQHPWTALILTYVVFALGFLARPLGGVFFGWLGDTHGRQRALIISQTMMAVPALLIGCLPTFNSIGVLSPILLCLLRICQGLSAGGEHTGSAIYIAEYAPVKQRSLWVSLVPASAALGMLISSMTVLFIVHGFTPSQLLAWGWRVGYWAGTLLCVIGIVLRLALPETPSFQKTRSENSQTRYPIFKFVKEADTLKALWIVLSLASSWGVIYQILFVWMPTYLVQAQRLSHSLTLAINSASILLFACLLLGVGYLADFIPRKYLLIASSVAMIVLAYPLFTLLAVGSLWQIYIAMAIFTAIFSLYLPAAFVSMIEAFDTKIRCTGLSLGFNLGLSIFGGTCPLLVTWLIAITKNNAAPAFYMILAALCTLLTSLWTPDKRGQAI